MSSLTPSPFSFGRSFGGVLLDEPRTGPGSCQSCGLPFAAGFKRYRYELCNRCLNPGRFLAQDEQAVKKRSFKSRRV